MDLVHITISFQKANPGRQKARTLAVRANLSICLMACVIAATPPTSLAATGDAQFSVAAQHYANRNWRLAVDEFDLLIEKQPDHKRVEDASFFAAESLLQLRQYQAAAKRLETFLVRHQSSKRRPRVMFRLGECFYLADQPTPAVERLEEFVTAYPDHELIQYALPYLANSLRSQGDTKAATETFQKSLESHPRGPLADECLLNLANDAYQRQKYDEAIQLLNRLQIEFPDSKLAIDAVYWLGMAEFDKGRYQAAHHEFTRVIQRAPLHTQALASRYFAAESLRRLEKFDEAAVGFETLSDAPNKWSDDAMIGQMRIAMQQQQPELVDDLATRFQALHGQSNRRSEVQQLHVQSFIRRQKFKQAFPIIDSLSRDSRITGKAQVTNQYLLSVVLLGMDRPEEALRSIRQIEPQANDKLFMAQLLLTRGTAFNSMGRYEDAIIDLRKAINVATAPRLNERIRSQLIYALTQTNEVNEAQQILLDWQAKSEPASAPLQIALQQLAESAFQQENYHVASQNYAKMLTKGQNNETQLRGLTGLAWCHFRQKNDQEALLCFDRLIARAPDSIYAKEAKLARARSLERLSQKEKALTAYLEIVEQPERDQRWSTATLAAATLLDEQSELEEAIRLLNLLVRRPELNQQMDQVWYQLAWVKQKQEQADAAAAAFNKIHHEYPESEYWADATFRLAEFAFDADRLKEASKLLAMIVQRDPDQSDPRITPYAIYLSLKIALKKERWPDVIALSARLIRQFPSSPLVSTAKFWQAEGNYQQRNFPEAMQNFEQLAKSEASESTSWQPIVLLRMAQIQASERDWSKVRELLSKLRVEFPDFDRNYEVDYLDGRQFSAAGDFVKARTAFQRTIDSIDGQYTETAAKAQWMIGESYMHQNNFERALRAYLKGEMVYDYPQWRAAALLQAGKCYEHMRQVNEARKVYQRMNDELPLTSFHAAARKRLSRLTVSPPQNDIP